VGRWELLDEEHKKQILGRWTLVEPPEHKSADLPQATGNGGTVALKKKLLDLERKRREDKAKKEEEEEAIMLKSLPYAKHARDRKDYHEMAEDSKAEGAAGALDPETLRKRKAARLVTVQSSRVTSAQLPCVPDEARSSAMRLDEWNARPRPASAQRNSDAR
jgi:hypothetical protein